MGTNPLKRGISSTQKSVTGTVSSEERDIKYMKIRHCYGVLRPSLEGYQVQTEIPYGSGIPVG